MTDLFYIDDIIIMQFSFYIMLFLSLLTFGVYLSDRTNSKIKYVVFGNLFYMFLHGTVLLTINGYYNWPILVGVFDVLSITFYIFALFKLFNLKIVLNKFILNNVLHFIVLLILSMIYKNVSILRMTTSLFIVFMIIDSAVIGKNQGDVIKVNSYWNSILNVTVFVLYKLSLFSYRLYTSNTAVSIDSIRSSIVFFTFVGLLLVIWINFTILFINYDILNHQYKHLSYHDYLTDIPNRRFAIHNVEQALNDSRNNNSLYGLILLDLDDFKKYNDQYGHEFGDEVLVQFVNRFKTLIRANDLFSRYGGDEFLVLIKIKDKEELIYFVNRINSYFNKTLLTNKEVQVQFSVGKGYVEKNTKQDVLELLDDIDKDLYKDKNK